jgi:hypothetical protein
VTGAGYHDLSVKPKVGDSDYRLCRMPCRGGEQFTQVRGGFSGEGLWSDPAAEGSLEVQGDGDRGVVVSGACGYLHAEGEAS